MFRLANLFDLSGRNALVTGGNSGIGLALARALGLAGAAIILVARREADLVIAAEDLQREEIAAKTLAADLADPVSISRIGHATADKQIDIIVNAAGVNLRQPFEAVDAESFDLHLAVHLRAPFLLVQRFAPAMAERHWGRVINLASMQSTRAFPELGSLRRGQGWGSSTHPCDCGSMVSQRGDVQCDRAGVLSDAAHKTGV